MSLPEGSWTARPAGEVDRWLSFSEFTIPGLSHPVRFSGFKNADKVKFFPGTGSLRQRTVRQRMAWSLPLALTALHWGGVGLSASSRGGVSQRLNDGVRVLAGLHLHAAGGPGARGSRQGFFCSSNSAAAISAQDGACQRCRPFMPREPRNRPSCENRV